MLTGIHITPLRSWPGRRRIQLRCVLFKHTRGKGYHFDLMLELGRRRKLWDLETAEAPTNASAELNWRPHGNHRRRYLLFEGELDKGRGLLEILGQGIYQVGASEGKLSIDIQCGSLCGIFELWRSRRMQHIWRRV